MTKGPSILFLGLANNHGIHHRGQLTIYLRAMGSKVPSIYGGSADVAIRAKVPGHYERPGEVLECTPLGYATHFRDETSAGDKANTIALLKQRGAPE
jgi:hypothetical protein